MTQNNQLSDACQNALQTNMRPDLFKALCDPIRISIVATLASRTEPSTVTDITDCCGIDFSGVSRHLTILKDAGVLTAKRDGRRVLYSLNAETLATTLRNIADALEICEAQIVSA